MGKRVYDYAKQTYRERTKLETIAAYTVRTIGVGIIAGLGYLGLEKGLGKSDQLDTLKADQEIAVAKYNKLYTSQSPERKFLVQYVYKVQFAGGEAEGGKGLIDLLTSSPERRVFTFNNACLRNSAYDTGGGYIAGSFSGLFSSGRIEGRSPAAVALAHVDRQEPDILEIRAGNNANEALRFSGVTGDSELRPADKRTEDVLATYGCQTGISSSTIVDVGLDRIG